MGQTAQDAAQPAHGAFDLPALGEDQVNPFPQAGLEIGADHGAAARQVDEVDRMLLALEARGGALLVEPMAVVVALIVGAGLAARHFDRGQIVFGRAAGLLAAHDRVPRMQAFPG